MKGERAKMEKAVVEAEEEEERRRLRVKRTIEAALLKCQRALELVNSSDDGFGGEAEPKSPAKEEEEEMERGGCSGSSPSSPGDREADELCDLLKSRVECPDFLEKLEVSLSPNNTDEGSSWDLVGENDLWEAEDAESDQEGYVLVQQEDIVEGIACFVAAYFLSLEQTKDLTPNQLQEALSKIFSVKKNKGKLQKAWHGSKVIYNITSWGATAMGIYQNPVIFRAASKAIWTSCHALLKLL